MTKYVTVVANPAQVEMLRTSVHRELNFYALYGSFPCVANATLRLLTTMEAGPKFELEFSLPCPMPSVFHAKIGYC